MLYLITAYNIDGSFRQWAQRVDVSGIDHEHHVTHAMREAIRTDQYASNPGIHPVQTYHCRLL